MATLSSLQRQIHELKQNKERLRRNAEEQIRRLNHEYRIRLSSLERGMTQAIRENNAQQALQFQQQMEQLRQQQERSIQEAYARLESELREQIEVRQNQLMEQLQTFCTQAEQQMDALERSMTQQDGEKAALAQKEYAEALEKHQRVEQRAHAQLFPGRMQVFTNSLQQARKMQEQGQFEASAATSVMLTVRLTDFEYEIDDKLTQWRDAFSKLAEQTGKIERKLEEALQVDGQSIAPEVAMEWLDHRYDKVFQLLDRCKGVIGRVEHHREQLGSSQITNTVAERYIRTGDGERVRDLEELVRALKYEAPRMIARLGEELSSLWHCVRQRKAWAETIEAYMRNKRNTGAPVRNDFQGETPGSNADGRMEFRQPLPGGQYRAIVCRILPVRHGTETENHIRFYFKGPFPNPSFQAMYMEQYISDLIKALQVGGLHIGLGNTPAALEGGADQYYSIQKDAQTGAELLIRHSAGVQAGAQSPESSSARAGTNGRMAVNSHRGTEKKKQKRVINR